MVTYKLFRLIAGKLYPLFVDTKQEMPLGEWLEAKVGELADAGHVKSRLGPLSLRPGFHSTEVPFTDWIGKRQGDHLVQRPDTVWCECEVTGIEGAGRQGREKDSPCRLVLLQDESQPAIPLDHFQPDTHKKNLEPRRGVGDLPEPWR